MTAHTMPKQGHSGATRASSHLESVVGVGTRQPGTC
jgi:hypothetical protein